jgi:quinol monooxygenase YgiN
MNLLIISMKVLSEKRMELSQTIASMCASRRREKGCQSCDFCQSIEDENRLFLLEEWDTQENLMTHLMSEQFRVPRGAMNLLEEPYEWGFHSDYHPAGMEIFNRGSDSLADILLPENIHLKQTSPTFK